jgi:hypothetical protein
MQTYTDSPTFSLNRGVAGAPRPSVIDEDEVPYFVFPDFADRPDVQFVPPIGVLLGDLD